MYEISPSNTHIYVVPEIVHAEAAQATYQPAVDELALGLAERDAGVLADELADLLELRVLEHEVPLAAAGSGWQ